MVHRCQESASFRQANCLAGSSGNTLIALVVNRVQAIEGQSMSKQVVRSLPVIQRRILLVRGQKVLLSNDLSDLYGVPPKVLIQAVKRNAQRFPEDFMFRLRLKEAKAVADYVLGLRSQIVTLKRGQHVKYPPYAFTEQGVAMLSSVLHSERAIQVNIAIMRAFVRLRDILVQHKEFAHKLNEFERKLESHDSQIRNVFEVIRQLMHTEQKPKRRIGF